MLNEYGKKRDFDRTPEPHPQKPGAASGPLSFVVQKHAASRLHYDFRLEVDGVLKSWAIPAGPSLDPKVKRLAVMVEDHPLDYGSFEGVIPEGEYGAGQVIVWDRGSYSPDEDARLRAAGRSSAEESVRQGLVRGKLSITLRGEKLKGSWALVRMRNGEKNWLLIKHQDEFAGQDNNLLSNDRSALSGLTIDDLKLGRLPAAKEPVPDDPVPMPAGSQPGRFPKSMSPMLATLTDRPFDNSEWLFEPKLDGFRIMAFLHDGQARLQSRNGSDVSASFPLVVESLQGQEAPDMILDGEIVAFDKAMRPCFQCLQRSLSMGADPGGHAEPAPTVYYVFDILYLNGFDLRESRLEDRRQILENILRPSGTVQIIESFEGRGETVYRASVEQGFEGIVAKRKDSKYEAGKRSANWLKVKASLSEEFVVAGYTKGQGARADSFGSLLLGYYDEHHVLKYAGHVGTGFDDQSLTALKSALEAIRSDESPFQDLPRLIGPATWVRPDIVVEVKFSEWTRDGLLRAPVFLRLRPDRTAATVLRPDTAHAAEANILAAGPQPVPAQPGIIQVLSQLQESSDSLSLEMEGHLLQLTSLDKAIWPSAPHRRALTKRDLLLYLATISADMLPHLRDRPLTLTRYPHGINGTHFYQKHYDVKLPAFVETVSLSEHQGKIRDYLMCNNLTTLLWLGQLADIEIHTWFSRVKPEADDPGIKKTKTESRDLPDTIVDYPDFIVFDLDPYIYAGNEAKGAEPELNRKAFTQAGEAALWLKSLLDELSLPSFVKTSGKTGLHIYVPILRQYEYAAVRSAAETIGRFLLEKHPKEITMEWPVEKRTGKIFLDHNRNARGQTLASIYSPRPVPEAAVSIPLRWDELGQVYPTDFTILTAPARLKQTGDLWSGILAARGNLKTLLGAGK